LEKKEEKKSSKKRIFACKLANAMRLRRQHPHPHPHPHPHRVVAELRGR